MAGIRPAPAQAYFLDDPWARRPANDHGTPFSSKSGESGAPPSGVSDLEGATMRWRLQAPPAKQESNGGRPSVKWPRRPLPPAPTPSRRAPIPPFPSPRHPMSPKLPLQQGGREGSDQGEPGKGWEKGRESEGGRWGRAISECAGRWPSACSCSPPSPSAAHRTVLCKLLRGHMLSVNFSSLPETRHE